MVGWLHDLVPRREHGRQARSMDADLSDDLDRDDIEPRSVAEEVPRRRARSSKPRVRRLRIQSTGDPDAIAASAVVEWSSDKGRQGGLPVLAIRT